MIENHALGILLGQKPCHPDVASSCSNEEDTPSQHGQTANEDGCNGWDDTQNNAGHHGSHHIAGNMHRLVTMAVGSQQFPHNTETDALPTAFCITCPRQAVNQFMNHDTHDDKDKGDASVAKTTKEFTYWLLSCPYPEKRHEEHDGCNHHNHNGKYIRLYNIDGHLAAFYFLLFHIIL